MSTERKYIITIHDEITGKISYLYDEPGWGYIFAPLELGSAKFFTYQEAREVFDQLVIDRNKTRLASDGTIYPHDMIHRGLEISHYKPKASGFLQINEVSLSMVPGQKINIKGEIKRPIGYTYN